MKLYVKNNSCCRNAALIHDLIMIYGKEPAVLGGGLFNNNYNLYWCDYYITEMGFNCGLVKINPNFFYGRRSEWHITYRHSRRCYDIEWYFKSIDLNLQLQFSKANVSNVPKPAGAITNSAYQRARPSDRRERRGLCRVIWSWLPLRTTSL